MVSDFTEKRTLGAEILIANKTTILPIIVAFISSISSAAKNLTHIMAINNWPEEQRPRERLIKHGAHILSDAELLAVFLRVGVSGKSAVDLGRDMISHFGSLNGLFTAGLADFSKIHGLGPAKYAQLQAVMELARRSLSEELKTGEVLGSPQAVKQYLQLLLAKKSYESFAVLFLDVKNRLIATEELFRGTLTQIRVAQHRNSILKCSAKFIWHRGNIY